MKLICVLPYCSSDHAAATRLLEWIRELDTKVDHSLLLVADDAVPMDTKKAIDSLGKSIFSSAETIMPKCQQAVNGNYHVPAASMFSRAAGHIMTCYKPWPWLWMEPDCVPLKSGWLDALADAYENSPKRFVGPIAKVKQDGVPPTVMFATAMYPHNAHEELQKFCDGKKAFDMAFSDHVVPRAHHTPLIQHIWGAVGDPPTFKPVKAEGDGENVGTLRAISKDAVLFHRNKDGSLMELLRNPPPVVETQEPEPSLILNSPIRRGPGRPPKQEPAQAALT